MLPHDPIEPTASPISPPVAPPTLGGAPGNSLSGPPQYLPAEGVSFDSSTSVQTTSVQKKPSLFLRGAMVVAALGVAGAGVFAVGKALQDPAGPGTPDEAVTAMMTALDDGDLIGIGEVMSPAEREAFIEPMFALTGELQRLEVLDPEMDMAAVQGLDIDVVGLETTTEELAPGIALVSVVGGTITTSSDIASLPLGNVITDRVGDELNEVENESDTVDFSEDPMELVTIERDGSWYVSLTYTIAEAARAETDAPLPAFGSGPAPVGAPTPGGSVEAMVREAIALDLDGVMTQLDPEEFAALYDYSPLFLPDAQSAIDEFTAEFEANDITWQLDALTTSSQERNGRTIVTVDGIAASGSFDGQTFAFDATGECPSLTVGGETETFCPDGDELAELEEFFPSFDVFADLEGGGVTVVERDGMWFVSGVPTAIYTYVDVFAALEPEEFDALIGDFENLLDGAMDVNPFDLGLGGAIEPTPFVEVDPFLEEDPFFEEDPFMEQSEVPVSAEDLALFPAEAALVVGSGADWKDPTWGEIPVAAASTGDDGVGNWVDILRYERGTRDEIISAMEGSGFYEVAELAAAPAGSAVYKSGFEYYVVIDNIVVIGWDDEPTLAHLDLVLPHLAEMQAAGQLP